MKLKLINKRMFKFIDWWIVLLIVLIVLYSLVALANATAEPVSGEEKSLADYLNNLNLRYSLLQLLWFGLGLIAMFVMLLPDYHAIGDFSKWIYWINIALLLFIFVAGRTVSGATAWFRLGERGLQPSEMMKIALIIIFAKTLSDKMKNEEGVKKIRDIIPLSVYFLIPLALVVLQVDWGTALVYVAIFVVMLFAAKTSYKLILLVLACGCAAVPAAMALMTPEQLERIQVFFNPALDVTGDATYQVDQAMIAIGSGQVTGKGLFAQGSFSQLNYVPERHTDFIFSVTVESLGLIGGIVLILLYFALIFRTLYLATRAKDDLGALMITGVIAMTVFHVFENIGMNMGLMPVTGIPLPFFSYGGSNFITNMIAFGLVLNVNMRRYRWSF